jgi:assimilatory nitrate reductase catalytic subunit
MKDEVYRAQKARNDERSAGAQSPAPSPRSQPAAGDWVAVCRLEDIVPNTGVCALVHGQQVAAFRLDDDRVFAIGNRDPFSRANVLSRGIVGDLKGEVVVASPVYKQHFSLATGQCLEDPAVRVPVFPARVEEGLVAVRSLRDHETRSTCCYCGVGCGVVIQSDGTRVTGVRGDPAHPANAGRLCTKGAALHLSTSPAARLLQPELRAYRQDARERVSWDAALDHAAARFAECVERNGPDSVAFYISGQLLTEDYYVFNKLAKGLVGTNNVDTNSRLCMSSAVAGYKLSLGVDAPPCCYEDIDHAELILIAGSNTAFAHPVVFRRIEDARAARPALKLIVIDPRRTVTAQAADLHLPIRPGTDVVLFNAMLHVTRREGLLHRGYIEKHTEGFAAIEQMIETTTPAHAAEVCDVPAELIVTAARWFAESRAALSLYCQGLNQSVNGTYKNSALINLHLATGQIGRPGAGPFSLTGQPNAMGGREVGGMANLLPAHRDLANPEHRAEVARLWGVKAVPEKPGKTAVEMFDAIGRGEIRMVWIACTNPAQSMPDATAVRRALERAEYVVVQDAFRDTDTCAYADLLLPATTWAEKDGTVTNSERCISRVRAAVAAPGEARADWEIAADFGQRLGARLGRSDAAKLFPYPDAEAVFDEHRATTAGRDLDITGLSYAVLERNGPQQWPFPAGAARGQARLYGDGVYHTPSGRARFVPTVYAGPAEQPDAAYPLRLNTGRLRDQWHSMTRTGLVARLFSHSPEPEISLHPGDLAARGLADGDLARIASRRGVMIMKVRASGDLRRGDAFLPMHWGSRFVSGAGTNALTLPAIDPYSGQPELKHAAVQVERFQAAWRKVIRLAPGTPDQAVELHRQMAPLLQSFDYGAITLAEPDGIVLTLEAASATQPSARTLAELDRLARVAPLPGLARLPQGRAVCSCLNVGESDIRRAIAAGQTLAGLQDTLRCGTQCGSCVPELKRLMREHAPAAGNDVTVLAA